MAKTILTKKMTNTDHVAWSMIAGLALALIHYSQFLALPAHFV